MINACIIRCCAWLVAGSPVDIHLDTTHPEIGMMPEYAEARRNLLDMFNGVCASVQFCLGSGLKTYAVPSPDGCSAASPITDISPSDEDRIAKALGGYLLVRPLFVARGVILAPKPQLRWLAGLMRHIAANYGIKLAAMMAAVDEEKGWPLFETGPALQEQSGIWRPYLVTEIERQGEGLEINVEMVG